MTADPDEQHLPASVLRRALEDAGNPWSLAPDANDEARPPEFPLGGAPPRDAPHGDEVERTDFSAQLRDNPPADPDVARACVEAGLLEPGAVPSLRRRPRDRRPEEELPSPGEAARPPDAGPDDIAPPVFGDGGPGREPT